MSKKIKVKKSTANEVLKLKHAIENELDKNYQLYNLYTSLINENVITLNANIKLKKLITRYELFVITVIALVATHVALVAVHSG